MADFDEKTLDPTPHRREMARAAGQVARSSDLSSAGLLLGGLAVLVVTGATLFDYLARLLTSSLGGQSWISLISSGAPPTAEVVISGWNPLVAGLAKVLLPPLALVVVVAVAINMTQTGFFFLPHKVAPDASRINPLAGLKRIFSAANALRLMLGLFKLAIIASVAVASVYQRREEIVSIGSFELSQVAAFVWDLCLSTCLKVGGALLGLATIDYAIERFRHERDLRMTPQELREEMRNLQGDPQVAARRKRIQRQPTSTWPTAVAQADAIIVDPTKAAVALRYASGSAGVPVVVAKGMGPLATRAVELAKSHGVAVVEKHSLAQALVREVGLNQPISQRHFAAVAEALAEARRAQNEATAVT